MSTEFGPNTSDDLAECTTAMFKALCRLIKEWPHQEMLSTACPDAVRSVARHFDVEPLYLYYLFAQHWFEQIDKLLSDKMAKLQTELDNMGEAIQELVTVWGPEYAMSKDDVLTVKRIAHKYDVHWALLYGNYVETDHRMHQEVDEVTIMDQAVKALLEVWPYKKPYGRNAVKITKGIARHFGVEWDDLVLAFNKVFVWPHEEGKA